MSVEDEYKMYRVISINKERTGGISIKLSRGRVLVELSEKFLKDHNLQNLNRNDLLWIKGRQDNEDITLWGMDTIEDIKKA
jgi:hypothetical protein